MARLNHFEHVASSATVMSLAFGHLETDWTSFGVDKSMDLGGHAAARATHVPRSFIFFDH
ncbi:hypothetical protein [Chelativorans sp. Marseille-P2723]|uniref:hypothetical protein n=1 Tax=Chelativorans sp. Marseille-P2723 TaxID=2709133 RepID=UPI001FEEAC34|nr:hypothetical protein [Chelativorans sp. Marseille-P2723]